jgi:uncharacterized membrane protein
MTLFRSLLIGVAAGMRSLTPLTALATAARAGRLPANTGAPRFLSSPMFSDAVAVLAFAELVGDKLPFAPDRIIKPSTVARAVSGSLAGMSMAPRESKHIGALIGAGAAVGSAYLSFDLRKRAIKRWGRAQTGLVEDLLAIGLCAGLLTMGRKSSH